MQVLATPWVARWDRFRIVSAALENHGAVNQTG
jgi:hypothetical protein